MRLLLLMLGISVSVGIGTRAEAQNYPWCAILQRGSGQRRHELRFHKL
jgi:hypothetical protein